MDSIKRREIMMKHYQDPINRGLIEDERYRSSHANHESCIDHIDIMMLIENDTIQDIRFEAEACAIVISSTSIMIEALMNKTKDEALSILNEYKKMINKEECDEKMVRDLIVYSDIYKQPNRIFCASLSADLIIDILNQKS